MGGPKNLIAKKFRGPNNLGNKQTSKHKDPVFKILRSRNEKFERKGVRFVLKFIPAISSPSIFGRTPLERRLFVFYSNCFINSTEEKIQPTFQMKAVTQELNFDWQHVGGICLETLGTKISNPCMILP